MRNSIKYFIFLFTFVGFQLCAQNAILVDNQKLTVTNLGGDNYTIGNNSELRISLPILANGTINLTSDSGWLILDGVLPSEAIASHLNYISVNGQPAVNKVNLRVTNYLRGCVIMPHEPNFEALSLYKDAGFAGEEMKCIPYKYYKIADLGSFDNTVSSFKLKKGYMATFAQNENGTGFSRVFIAENEDVQISTLQVGLNNLISFVRVFPWRYTEKKGMGWSINSPIKNLRGSWFYNWGTKTSEDATDIEFVPTRWSAKSFTDTRWQEILDNNYSSHLLGYNEPDGATQANMTLDQMLLYWPRMLESGLRLGSPAVAGTLPLLYEFMDKCDELNYRVDFVAMHDYGEGTALAFYNKCKAVHDRTGRPIWIKEFNFGGTWTPGKPTYAQSAARIKEIIEMYDKEGIIERYAIFNFDEEDQNRAVFYNPVADLRITPLGEVYRNQLSTMSFNAIEQINIPLKLVAPQNLKITNSNGTINKLVWENFNFADVGTIFIERAAGTGGFVTVAQISSNNSSYNDDISATGLVQYSYRLSVRHTGFVNSKFAIGSIDLNPYTIFNVALNKSVFASSIHSAPYPAEKAVDGDVVSDTSRWVTKAGELPAYIEIDLNGTFLISQLKFYSGYQGYNSPITSFVFQYWNGTSWEDIITETSNTISLYSKNFNEVRTDKVRLNINSTGSGIARFYEIEVYGRISNSLSVNEFSLDDFKIYPNPASNLLFISGATDVEFLEITDLNGKQLIKKSGANSVDISQLSSGVYFIKLNNKETFKFIKK